LVAFIEETGFRQVLLNLIINSRDAIGKNGKIKISAKRIDCGKAILNGARSEPLTAPCDGAEITVEDNGTGIPAEITEKIFDPFFTTKDTAVGSGFGLYNCKLFVEDHGGIIGFNSKQGKGTKFYIFLPIDTKS